jgi:ATP-dependent Lhr-like helicase
MSRRPQEHTIAASSPLEGMSPAARTWFEDRFGAPTPVQADGWARIASGDHALLLAPTGSGKTLAAFFYAIDRLSRRQDDGGPGVRVVYVSPQKALAYDIERNLREPLAGVRRAAGDSGLRLPRVAVRTGDTSARERRAQSRDPAEILVTTPESLYLILGSAQRETLRSVDTVIVDEIHALAPTKRGAHLALSLERLSALAARDPQRIGLSATARPVEEVARFLGGDRRVEIVDHSARPHVELLISSPVPDMTRPDEGAERPADASPGSLWPAIHPKLLELVRSHESTIVFVNSRGLCERLSQQLNELAGEELVRAHHGSLAHAKRREMEEALKAGRLRGIVATSSLELGIDMGSVDLVVMVESPGAVSRGLQRVGRAGHHVGAASVGRIYPKHRGDLLEAVVVAEGMQRGDVEALHVPGNPLDVLAQQIVADCAAAPTTVDALEARVRRAANYRDLSREALCGVLDMLSGRYPSTDFSELRARIVWDREHDRLEARRGARQLATMSGGTIPDRGLYPVLAGEGGARVGELDEEMVYESRPGETLTLGASTWRIEEITRDRVIVSPAPGEVGKLPFWRGDGPGRPLELGRAVGAFVREIGERCALGDAGTRAAAEAWLCDERRMDPWAARNLLDYVSEQRQATGCLPTDRALTVERFRDELGDWRICLLSPFGSRVHAPWALAIESLLGAAAGFDVQALWSDDGIALRFADGDAPPERASLFPDPEQIEDLVVEQLARSALFAGQFRENAARALLLPRRRPGARTPLWTQRLRAQNLLAVAREFPSFPIVLETYRSCLRDVFDVPALASLLTEVRERRIRIDEVETRMASPFARSLVFAYTAAYLYQGDTPVAERRAQALTLDRAMLRDLLGEEDLRSLLDADVVREVECELVGASEVRRVGHADALHDRLREVGDLEEAEILSQCGADGSGWIRSLVGSRRAVLVEVAGERRFIAVEDAGLYRDALAVALPDGLPDAHLEVRERPLEQLLLRYARCHGPFAAERAAARFGLAPQLVGEALESLRARERLLHGAFLPGGETPEWCEPGVLRRLRRRTLAKLRSQVAPVPGATLARFLTGWHGIGEKRGGEERLRAALEQLEGLPLSFSELERSVLPSRVSDYEPRMLDALGALGHVVWIGAGALGARDGRIVLVRRERVATLVEAPTPPADLDAVPRVLLDHLTSRGASFFSELSAAAGHPSERVLLDALWELVWQGLVTNDTFAPLRALSARRAAPTRRTRRGTAVSAAAGRWSAVSALVTDAPDPTRRAHARAVALLERYGVVARGVLANEPAAGGFAALYPVYREMEDAGKLRRGRFVEGLEGAQFAYAGVVDRLRATRDAPAREALLLAAMDPANPYGSVLPWPRARSEQASARRAVGASVVLVDGSPALFLERSGRRVVTFEAPEGAAGDDRLARALAALRGIFAERRRRLLRIEQIDAQPALRSELRATFEKEGFRADYKGLVLERFPAAAG